MVEQVFMLKILMTFGIFFILQRLLRVVINYDDYNIELRKCKPILSIFIVSCFFIWIIDCSVHKVLNNEVLITSGFNKKIEKVIDSPGLYFTMPIMFLKTYNLNKEVKIDLIGTYENKKEIFTKDIKKLYITDGNISYNIKNSDSLTKLIQMFGFNIRDSLHNYLFNMLRTKATTFTLKEFSENKLSQSVIKDFYQSLEKELGIEDIKKYLEINIIVLTSNKPR